MGNDMNCVRPRRKHLMMSVHENQLPTLLYLVKDKKTSELGRILHFLKKEDAKKLVNFKDEQDRTLLMHAVYNTDPVMVEMLLNYGADVTKKDKKGKNAIFYTVSKKNLNRWLILEILAEHDCPLNEEDNEKNTFLHICVKANEEKLVEILLRKGADPNKLDKETASSLHYSVDNQNFTIVKMLIKSKADVNHVDMTYLWTALHVAAIRDDARIIEFLLKNGAKTSATDRIGNTPLSYARGMFCFNAVECLERENDRLHKNPLVHLTDMHKAKHRSFSLLSHKRKISSSDDKLHKTSHSHRHFFSHLLKNKPKEH